MGRWLAVTGSGWLVTGQWPAGWLERVLPSDADDAFVWILCTFAGAGACLPARLHARLPACLPPACLPWGLLSTRSCCNRSWTTPSLGTML